MRNVGIAVFCFFAFIAFLYYYTPAFDGLIREASQIGEPSCGSEEFAGALTLHTEVADDHPNAIDPLRDDASFNEEDKVKFDATPALTFDKNTIELVRRYIDEFSMSPQVNITLTEEAGRQFAELSRSQIGKKIAIFANGEYLIAPIVQTEITGGSMMISAGMPDEEGAEPRDLFAELCPSTAQ